MAQLRLTGVRMAFNDLFTPQPTAEGAKPSYNCTVLVPTDSPDYEKVIAAAKEALNTKFPGKGEAMYKQIFGNSNRCCLQDGDTVEYDGYAGHLAIRTKSYVRPLVINRDRSPVTEADGVLYSGCYVTIIFEFFGYDKVNKGLSAGMRGVQFHHDGDSFAGGRAANTDEFDDLGDGTDSDFGDDLA
jgi:hypothetical protein